MTKRDLVNYGSVIKNLSKSHSVGDGVWSEESFIEGFKQAVQFLEPNADLVLCPRCNTSSVMLTSVKFPKDSLPVLQYPSHIDTMFECHKCEHEFSKQLRMSAE
jgi:transcription elongation factor Elf1